MMGRIPQSQLARVEKNGVEISAFPIKKGEDSLRYFDEDLLDEGILAVYLVISNKTSDSANLNTPNLKVGEKIVAAGTSSLAYNAAKRGYGLRAFLWMFPTYFVGAPASAVHTYNVNKEMKKDLIAKSILESDREVKPFGTSQGFVWFKIPGDLPKEIVLNLFLEFGFTKKTIMYEIPLPD